jgi:hypothetical protein
LKVGKPDSEEELEVWLLPEVQSYLLEDLEDDVVES